MSKHRALMIWSVVAACAAACTEPATEEHQSAEQQIGAAAAEPGTGTCSHAPCMTGQALEPACEPCVTSVCALDPYCCQTAWDATCVGEVGSICGQSCGPAPHSLPEPAPNTCAHPLCSTGGPLAAACSPCATTLCAQDPYCCSVAWDAICVGEVGSICGQACN